MILLHEIFFLNNVLNNFFRIPQQCPQNRKQTSDTSTVGDLSQKDRNSPDDPFK